VTRSFFAPVARREVSAAGITLLAPGFYPDVRAMSGLFTADLAAARRLLPGPRYRALTLGRRALVAIHCFEYRGSPVGDYHEVSVAIGVQVDALARPSALALAASALLRRFDGYIVDLPVNTELARAAGVALFGYPKFLADIRFEEDARSRRCVVSDPDTGALIYALRGDKLRTHATALERRCPGAPAPTRRGLGHHVTCNRSYPLGPEGPRRAHLHLNALERAARPLRGFQVELGDHPRAANLAALAPGRLLVYEFVPQAEAILEAPEPLGPGPG
jgi:hypothetical protein